MAAPAGEIRLHVEAPQQVGAVLVLVGEVHRKGGVGVEVTVVTSRVGVTRE